VSSFANTSCGHLEFGVEETGGLRTEHFERQSRRLPSARRLMSGITPHRQGHALRWLRRPRRLAFHRCRAACRGSKWLSISTPQPDIERPSG
jgi:hypothetical protein